MILIVTVTYIAASGHLIRNDFISVNLYSMVEMSTCLSATVSSDDPLLSFVIKYPEKNIILVGPLHQRSHTRTHTHIYAAFITVNVFTISSEPLIRSLNEP
jgi:hypothetical protein